MGLFSAADTFYAFRFLRLLTTKWENTGAFKAGLIDTDGKQIRKAETGDERAVYNIFHRLVFNVKRLINKVPFGKSTVASYLAALYLIKEHTGMSDAEIGSILFEAAGIDITMISEGSATITLSPTIYVLTSDAIHPKTGETIGRIGTSIDFSERGGQPLGHIFGHPVFEGRHAQSGQRLIVCATDIE